MTRLICFLAFALAPAFVSADLVSFSDDFANSDGAGGVNQPANWNIDTANTTFSLQSGDADDLDFLDSASDGYAALNGNVTANGGNFNPSVSRSLGVVTAADVGSLIELDLAYLEVSVGANFVTGITMNGSYVQQVSGGTFGANPNGSQTGTSYTVTSADIGATAAAKFQFFSSQDARVLGLDAVNVTISPLAVPEPASSTILIGLSALLICRRRK